MFFEHKIRYLDYYKNGERVKSGGFAKTEVRDDSFRLEIVCKGISCADMNAVDVLLCGGGREIVLGQLSVKNGCGEFSYRGTMKNGIDGTGMQYGEISGIRIPLGDTAEISGAWLSARGTERSETKKYVAEEAEECKAAENPGETSDMEKVPEPEKAYDMEKAPDMEKVSDTEKTFDAKKTFDTGERQPEPIALLEDKWIQLVSIYPHIKPFRDEREYLSIGPADFVLFAADSYRTANNSFLLHGYYNYRHLILTRVERRGEILYYVGVPGNYYDREKQVAVMFGFESFECAAEPAQNGDFGYYMMRVKL